MISAQSAHSAGQPIGDGLAAAERLLAKLRHDPGAIAATLGAPVVLVVIFGYIFGSAISVPGGGNYRAYLVSGLFAVIAANILPSMVAVARDSARGVVDRFRSLPISRAALPSDRPPPPPRTAW
jgi:ABC-2 type transport system permease protein